jgi:hypothetical protein
MSEMDLPYGLPPMETLMNSITFCVSVPASQQGGKESNEEKYTETKAKLI